MRYDFFAWADGSGSCVHSGEFDSDHEALAFVATLDPDKLYTVEALDGSCHRIVGGSAPSAPATNWKNQLREDWKALPLPVRAAFAPIRTCVFVAIDDGDLELARSLIETASVPEELEPVRQSLLSAIP